MNVFGVLLPPEYLIHLPLNKNERKVIVSYQLVDEQNEAFI